MGHLFGLSKFIVLYCIVYNMNALNIFKPDVTALMIRLQTDLCYFTEESLKLFC